MTLVKSAILAGTFLGGWACDRVSLKGAVITAFLLTALGMSGLSFSSKLLALTASAVLAQLGNSMYPSSARLLVTTLVPRSGHQESIGWLRTANNLGQIIAFTVGWLSAGWGVAGLMLFDAATSLAAAALGWKLLPRSHASLPEAETPSLSASSRERTWLLVAATLIAGCFSLGYDAFMVSAAARLRLSFGEDGLRVFSQAMVVNTALCAALAVGAARLFRSPSTALPLGILLQAAGGIISLAHGASRERIFAGFFVLTLGEVVFMAMSSFMIMRLTPGGRRQGSIYGGVLLVQGCGRIIGSALAFPLVVHGSSPAFFFVALAAIALALWFPFRRGLARALAI